MARFFQRRKFCRFTAEGVDYIDYKDLEVLKEYISETDPKIICRATPHIIYRGSALRLLDT